MIECDNKFLSYISTAVNAAQSFGSSIEHLHIKETETSLVIAGVATDNSVLMNITIDDLVGLGEMKLCMGNLRFLKQLVTSPLNKTPILKFAVKERNGKNVAEMMIVKPNEHMDMVYVCTDPYRGSITRPLKITTPMDSDFVIDEDVKNKILQLQRIHAAAPSTGKEDIVEFRFREDMIHLGFGYGGSHQSSMIIEDCEISKDLNGKALYLLSNQITKALGISDPPLVAECSNKSVKFSHMVNDITTIDITLVGRRVA